MKAVQKLIWKTEVDELKATFFAQDNWIRSLV